MEDILSPTHTFFDFDFSEFIDKNFDMSNEILNSPNQKIAPTPTSHFSSNHLTFDDFLSSSNSSESGSEVKDFLEEKSINKYTNESPSSYLDPLWLSIEELAYKTDNVPTTDKIPGCEVEPPTLSCIDEFIKDPHSDLVQLVEKSSAERLLFQHLIICSLSDHVSTTPLQILQKHQQQEQKQEQKQEILLQDQHHHLRKFHARQNFDPHLAPSLPPQHPLDQYPLPFHNNKHLHQLQHNSPLIQAQQKKRKSSSAINSNSQNKRMSKSSSYSSNSSNYTHSDSVNAQLLRELIRQAGKNNPNLRNGSSDSTYSANSTNNGDLLRHIADYSRPQDSNYENSMLSGNYQAPFTYSHPSRNLRPSSSITSSMNTTLSHPSSSHLSRQNLPYHIQTSKNSSPNNIKYSRNMIGHHNHHPQHRNYSMGRPSMYSSDISQAQLLEIQAISRAQQDFIRAREQQEIEKELMLKRRQQQQHKKKI